MKTVSSIIFVSLLFLSCGSSSVYQMTEEQQKGITFNIYEEQPDVAFEQVRNILMEYDSNNLVGDGWQIVSSDEEEGTIETNWRETTTGGSIGAGSESNERFRFNVEISEDGEGSRVFIELQKQVKMSGEPETAGQWQMFEINRRTANNYIQPIFSELEEAGLTPRD